jgi:hypothetical protein
LCHKPEAVHDHFRQHQLMKALRFAEFGPPSVLRIEEVAIPQPLFRDVAVAPEQRPTESTMLIQPRARLPATVLRTMRGDAR